MVGPDFNPAEIEAWTSAIPQVNKAIEEFADACNVFGDSITEAVNAAINKEQTDGNH